MKHPKQLLITSLLVLSINTSHADLVLKWSSFITKNHPAVVGENQPSSGFGFALTSADNQLYINSLRYALIDNIDSGAVHKLVGNTDAPLGIHPHNKLIHQGHFDNDSPVLGDQFGHAIVAARTQGGGESQLIIGVPSKDVDGTFDSGMVHYIQSLCDECSGTVLSGSIFHQNTPGIIGGNEDGDLFGFHLASGDFNGDDYEDVAIGVPLEDIGDISNAGAVQIIMADGANGLAATNNQFWSRNSTSVLGVSEPSDKFGSALASGDFNGDGIDDLAIGVNTDDVDGVESAGSVHILYGVAASGVGLHDNGLNAVGNQIWHQNSAGIFGGAEDFDQFGDTLAAGDFNGDGADDLAIGVPFEGIGDELRAGAVNIIYGSMGVGLTADNDLFISQDEPGFVGASEAGDQFGNALAVGDLNADGIDDLAIGAFLEDVNGNEDSGAVYVVHGSNTGLQFNDEYTITEGNLGGTLGLRTDGQFGRAMTINDFDGDGKDDLAISTNAFSNDVNSVSVIYQQDYDVIFADGFEG